VLRASVGGAGRRSSGCPVQPAVGWAEILCAASKTAGELRRFAMLSRRLIIMFWFAIVLLVSCPNIVRACDHFQPVRAEELAMKSEPLAPGAPAIILYRQLETDDNRKQQCDYLRIKVLTEEGRTELCRRRDPLRQEYRRCKRPQCQVYPA